jgi:5-formyltetrahydrofolate cyclo-ligase
MLAKRNSLTEQIIQSRSKQIQEIFTTSHLFEKSKVLGIYLAHDSEVRTKIIIETSFRERKTIAMPRVIDSSSMRFYEIDEQSINSLIKGKFGISEPNGTENDVSKALDLLIVPGIAFDLHGHRLGHGMGYYDNFLRNKRPITTVGLAFDFQITRNRILPHSEYDMKVNNVVTETGIYSYPLD